jgi:hypothetical protein
MVGRKDMTLTGTDTERRVGRRLHIKKMKQRRDRIYYTTGVQEERGGSNKGSVYNLERAVCIGSNSLVLEQIVGYPTK